MRFCTTNSCICGCNGGTLFAHSRDCHSFLDRTIHSHCQKQHSACGYPPFFFQLTKIICQCQHVHIHNTQTLIVTRLSSKVTNSLDGLWGRFPRVELKRELVEMSSRFPITNLLQHSWDGVVVLCLAAETRHAREFNNRARVYHQRPILLPIVRHDQSTN